MDQRKSLYYGLWLNMLNMCRQLTELALLFCQKIGNNALLEVGRGCKFLQALHLVDCSSIGDEGICGIARGCQKLKKLHIRRCYEVLSLSLSLARACTHKNTHLILLLHLLPNKFLVNLPNFHHYANCSLHSFYTQILAFCS
jgi:hypothetical protein